jgi:hypothetical protein
VLTSLCWMRSSSISGSQCRIIRLHRHALTIRMIDSSTSEEPVERYINKLSLSLGRSRFFPCVAGSELTFSDTPPCIRYRPDYRRSYALALPRRFDHSILSNLPPTRRQKERRERTSHARPQAYRSCRPTYLSKSLEWRNEPTRSPRSSTRLDQPSTTYFAYSREQGVA